MLEEMRGAMRLIVYIISRYGFVFHIPLSRIEIGGELCFLSYPYYSSNTIKPLDRAFSEFRKVRSFKYIWYDLKPAYPKWVKNVKNMSNRRFLKPKLFNQKQKLKF